MSDKQKKFKLFNPNTKHIKNKIKELENKYGVKEHDIELKDFNTGKILYSSDKVRSPENWSAISVQIAASKYFAKGENSIFQMVLRIVETAKKESKHLTKKYPDIWDDLTEILLNQEAAFNSPVWFNFGVNDNPYGSACFILGLEDTMDDILEKFVTAGNIFKNGSGMGMSFSKLRGDGEALSKGGKASGPLSFMKSMDSSAGVIKSGGRCIPAEQKVLTDKGSMAVKDLLKEDFIYSVSYNQGFPNPHRIEAWKEGNKRIYEINTNKGKLHTSFDHPFLLADKETIKKAEKLKKGDILLSYNHKLARYDYENVIVNNVNYLREDDVYKVHITSFKKDTHTYDDTHNFPIGFLDNDSELFPVVKNTRRSANLFNLKINHPDIMDFIRSKSIEEDKMRALINSGFSSGMDGEATKTVSLQNVNISIAVTDDFMRAYENNENYDLISPHTGEVRGSLSAREVMKEIAENTWKCGDPGLQFIDTINKAHTVPSAGDINVSNPCLAGDTPVVVAGGITDIKDLDGKVSKIKHKDGMVKAKFFKTGVKDVYRITAENGKYVDTTEDHLWKTPHGWVEAKKLKGKLVNYYKENNFTTEKVISVEYIGKQDVYDFTILDKSKEPSALIKGFELHNCSEFLFLDYSACNLASINLDKLYDGKEFNWLRLEKIIKVLVPVMDSIVDFSGYPDPKITSNSKKYRPLGLGYASLGSLLMSMCIPYDSDEGREWAAKLTNRLTYHSYKISQELAHEFGHNMYKKEQKSLRDIVQKHHGFKDLDGPFRNAQTTVMAPTGCLTGDTMVLSSEGILPIQEYGNPEGKKWQDLDVDIYQEDSKNKATKFYLNGKDDVIKIMLSNGSSIKATKKHKFRIIDKDGNYIWKKTKDLNLKDNVVLSLGGHEDLLGDKPYIKLKNDSNFNFPKELNEDFAEILGFYMANGYTKKRSGLHLVINNEDTDLIDKFKKWSELSGFSSSLEHRQGCVVFNIYSYGFKNWFLLNGFSKDEGNHGEGAYSAFIPENILKSKTSVICSFLRGLFTGDGTVNGKSSPIIEYSTVSPLLAKQLHVVLMYLDIYSYKSVYKRTVNSKSFGSKDIYRIRVSGKDSSLIFKDKINFLSKRKITKLEIKSKTIYKNIADNTYSIKNKVLINEFYKKANKLPADIKSKIRSRKYDNSFNLKFIEATVKKYEELKDTKLGKLLDLGNIRIVPIKDLINIGKKLTYDISVPDNNTYIANGFVSHNTISLLMDAQSTGIEPLIAVASTKVLAGGGKLDIIPESTEIALDKLGYNIKAARKHLNGLKNNFKKTLKGFVKEEHLPIFETALDSQNTISPMAHVNMLASIQENISGGISKTVNLSNKITVEEIEDIYYEAWKKGVKAVALYRDGSKAFAPIVLEDDEDKKEDAVDVSVESLFYLVDKMIADLAASDRHDLVERFRKRLKDTRQSVTHKFSIGGHKGYITLGLYDNGEVGEVFINMSKQGSTLSGIMDAFATNLSIALQYGIPIEIFYKKFTNTRFEPAGMTANSEIPMVKSPLDYIFRWIQKYLETSNKYEKNKESHAVEEMNKDVTDEEIEIEDTTGMFCPECGGLLIPSGSCSVCKNCGASTGCS